MNNNSNKAIQNNVKCLAKCLPLCICKLLRHHQSTENHFRRLQFHLSLPWFPLCKVIMPHTIMTRNTIRLVQLRAPQVSFTTGSARTEGTHLIHDMLRLHPPRQATQSPVRSVSTITIPIRSFMAEPLHPTCATSGPITSRAVSVSAVHKVIQSSSLLYREFPHSTLSHWTITPLSHLDV